MSPNQSPIVVAMHLALLLGLVLFFYSLGSMVADSIWGHDAKNERFWSGIVAASVFVFFFARKMIHDFPKV